MSGTDIHQKVHQAVEQVTSAAKPDPWLAQKIRVRAQGKEEQHMKKKLPAGAAIVIAVMLLMTAVAAAVTNGFGLLRQFPEQAENAAFTDRIVTIGQTWEGKYFSAEIKEAVFDGSKLRFSMSVTPKENAPQMYVKPVVKAVYGDREHKTDMVLFNGTELSGGFWVPGINPPIHEIQPDLNDMVFEVSLVDHEMMPLVTDVDVEWTFTFNVLKTDWKIDFTKFPEPDVVESGDDTITIDHDVWMEYDKQGRKMQADAYARHELLLNEYGYGLEDIITQPFEDGYRSLTITGNYDDFMLDLYTREVFTQEDQAVFSFVAERAEIRKPSESVSFVLPEKQKCIVKQAAATADEVSVIVETKYYHFHDEWGFDTTPWDFVLKSDETELLPGGTHIRQSWDDNSAVLVITYVLNYRTTKPLHSVILVPVQNTGDSPVELNDLAITINLE